MEIRRLIEEGRNISKGEKQRLQDLSKQKRKCIRDKKRTKKSKNTRRLQRNQEHTRHQLCKKNDTHHEDTKRSHYIKKRNCQRLWRIYSKLYDDVQYDETEMESDKNETENNIEDQATAALTCTTTIPKRRKKFQKSRLKSCRLPSKDSKKGKSADSN